VRIALVILRIAAALLPALQLLAAAPACTCADGRSFRVGASVFGNGSARILITGFKTPTPSDSPPPRAPSECRYLAVVAQTIRTDQASGRVYLKREVSKRGILYNVCQTGIHFVEIPDRHDVFSGDLIPITPAAEGAADDSVSADKNGNGDKDGDLAGLDLIRMIKPTEQSQSPKDGAFDERDIKEGALVIVSHRAVALRFMDPASAPVLQPSGGPRSEIRLAAGTPAKLVQRGGTHSSGLWIVELLSDPTRPFWLLFPMPRRAAPGRVLLSESQFTEANRYLDRLGAEITKPGDSIEAPHDDAVYRLAINAYAPRHVPLEENLNAAIDDEAEKHIVKSAERLTVRPRPGVALSAEDTMTIEESGLGTRDQPLPDLIRRQCFVRRTPIGTLHAAGAQQAGQPGYRATHAEVRIFRPVSGGMAPSDYYAVDLALEFQDDTDRLKIEAICRFPWTRIDVDIVRSASQILSNKFVVEESKKR